MSEQPIPDRFFDMLPLPVLVAKNDSDALNHSIVYLNRHFAETIGWSLFDIPDKNAWWQKAYPDKDYQKVVERQWELGVEFAREKGEASVEMEVNIVTKEQGIKRFKVYSEQSETLIPGYYIVVFEPI